MQAFDAETVDSVVGAVLSRPAFAPPAESLLALGMRRLREWTLDPLVELFRRIIDWLFPDPATREMALDSWDVFLRVVLFVVGVWLLVRLGMMAVGALRRRGVGGVPKGPADGPRGPATAAEWEWRAGAAAGEGRWRDAAVALYQAVLHRLAQDDRLRLDPAKTPGDYRREVRGEPSVAAALDRFVRRFEAVVFAGRPPDATAYEGLRAAARLLGVGPRRG